MSTADVRLPTDALADALGRSGATASDVLDLLRAAARLRRTADALQIDPDEALRALETVAADLPAGAAVPVSTLTDEQEQVLRAAGSLAEPLPAPAERASLRTAAADAVSLADAVSVRGAADALGVSDSRVRQRLAARSLLGVHTSAGWRIPRALLEAERRTPGLDRVLPAFPPAAHPAAVLAFLQSPHVDLRLDAEPVSPLAWLAAGGDADAVITLVRAAYEIP